MDGRLPLPLAPLPSKRRIVAEIETQFTRLDAAVAALKRVQARLRRYKASVLKAACEGRLVPTEAELARAEGREYEPAAVLLQRILSQRRAKWEAEHPGKRYQEPEPPDTSELPELPEGWVWAFDLTCARIVDCLLWHSPSSPRDGFLCIDSDADTCVFAERSIVDEAYWTESVECQSAAERPNFTGQLPCSATCSSWKDPAVLSRLGACQFGAAHDAVVHQNHLMKVR